MRINGVKIDSWKVHLFVYIALLFSGFSNLIFDYDGLYVFELAVLVAIVYSVFIPNSISRISMEALYCYARPVSLVVGVVFFFMILGWIIGGNFANAYTDFRANLIGVLGYFWACFLLRLGKWRVIAYAGLFSGACSLLSWFYVYNLGVLDAKFAAPVIACAIAVMLFRENLNYKLAILSLLVLIVMSAVGFYRQYWFYVLFSALLLFKNSSRLRYGKINLFPILVLSMIPLFSIGYGVFLGVVGGNESLYIQSIGKTEDLLNFFSGTNELSESDAIRVAYFEYIYLFWYKIILPHGLGYKSFFDSIDPWFFQYSIEANTIDSLFFYLSFHYGLLLAMPLIIYFIIRLGRNSSYGNFEKIIFLLMGFNIMLFDGAQATVISRSLWLGVYVAFISTRRSVNN